MADLAATALPTRPRRTPLPCPTDDWQEHHRRAKADAATGAPVTPEGRSLLATARDAGGGRVLGECVCGSSFLFTLTATATATAKEPTP